MRQLWTEEEIAALGTDTDAVIAAELGRTESSVLMARRNRGIPAFQSHARKWTKRELNMLGKKSDGEIAAILGCSRKHVFEMRKRRGIGRKHGQK